MKVALIGATGLVGQKMIQVLEERKFPVTAFFPAASSASIGKKVTLNNQQYPVISIEDAIAAKPAIALFSAGGSVSLRYAPLFAQQGTFVIDNSSAWRMYPDKKLIVPEVNGALLTKEDKIIANPNCSTIQLVMALAPLHRKYKIHRLIVSTYQSVTGTGQLAFQQLMDERKGISGFKKYPHPIDLNCFPHGGDFTENGYTTEEIKLENETRKILGDQSIAITATVVRIPVVGGHSETVNIEFEHDFELADIVNLLSNAPGIVVQDKPEENLYPMPLTAHDKDEVFVGRIRRDFSKPKSLNMWVVSDNLRKGAATNAIQIAETLTEKKFV